MYEISQEERDTFPLFGLTNTPTTPEGVVEGHNRDVNRDKFTGSVVYAITDQITVTPSFAYWHNRVKQDLVYASSISLPATQIPDNGVRYTDVSQNYSLAVSYMPKDKLNLGAEVSHTIAHGNFYPHALQALDPISIGEFSRLDITETVYSVSARYEFLKNTEIGVDYSYTDFDTKANPLNPEDEDGIANVLLVSLTKRWF